MIRRVLTSVINYDHPQSGMLHAFRGLFQDVADYDYLERKRSKVSVSEINDGLVRIATSFQPQWIWLQLQDLGIIRPGTLTRLRNALPKTVISHWMGDMRASVGPYIGAVSKECHLTLTSSVGQIAAFQAAGARRTLYSQVGLDWAEDVMGEPAWEPPFRIPDVVFCSNYYGSAFPGSPERVEAVAALLHAGIDVGVVGQGWPRGFPVVGKCGVKQQTHVYRRAKVALSVNNFNDVELFYSDRHLIALASGTPLVSRYVPGLEREFTNGRHLLWYSTPGELVESVRSLLGSEDLRRRIGRQGRAEAIRSHTWFSRILSVLPHVEEEAATL